MCGEVGSCRNLACGRRVRARRRGSWAGRHGRGGVVAVGGADRGVCILPRRSRRVGGAPRIVLLGPHVVLVEQVAPVVQGPRVLVVAVVAPGGRCVAPLVGPFSPVPPQADARRGRVLGVQGLVLDGEVGPARPRALPRANFLYGVVMWVDAVLPAEVQPVSKPWAPRMESSVSGRRKSIRTPTKFRFEPLELGFHAKLKSRVKRACKLSYACTTGRFNHG